MNILLLSKSHTLRNLSLLGWCIAFVAGCRAEVKIAATDNDFQVTTGSYEAVVAKSDGALTNLTVSGQSFIQPGPPAGIRGSYFFQNALVPLPNVTHPKPNVVVASGDKATVRYRFDEGAMAWTATNRTAQPMLFIIVMPSGIGTITDTLSGQSVNAPTKQNWSSATYTRGAARVLVSGTTRLWDFAENTQVLEMQLAPNETRVLSFEIEATKIASNTPSPMTTPTQSTPVAATLPKLAASPALWDLSALHKPPPTYPAPEYSSPAAPNVKSLFFEGLPYAGKPSRVFAFLGIPEMEPGEKVPAMVLIHGGMGTAYLDWVKLWVTRGYAVIAMDLNGKVPTGEVGSWTRHEWAGPAGINAGATSPFRQIELPLKEQWTYHAVANALLAHSLLRSQQEVDPNRIGVTGVSWGGYMTSLVAGVDERFKFAAPVYGSGFLTENSAWLPEFEAMGKEKTEAWRKLWDPSQYLPRVKIPMLWLNGTNDFAYPLDSWLKSAKLPQSKSTLVVRVGMAHGHGPVSEAPEEIHAFANHLFKRSPPLARVVNQGRKEKDVWAYYESTLPMQKAELNFSTDKGKWQDRKWSTLPAQIDATKKRITATLPDGANVYYFNLFDERGLIVSTPHEELPSSVA